MKRITGVLTVLFFAGAGNAQYKFIIPTFYHGVIADHTLSARSEALGKNTITLNGIRTAFENPATISPGDYQVQVALNYTKGHPWLPKSYYPFAGVSGKITSKIALGISTHHWIDPKSYWNTEIGGQTYPTETRKQHVYSFVGAGEIIDGLHVGISGNLINEQAIDNITTSKDFVLNTGVIYDKPVSFIKKKEFTKQQLRVAASLFNTLLKGRIIQSPNDSVRNFRDMPIILRVGAAYGFSIPFNPSFAQKSKKLKNAPQTLDLSARIQYANWLKDEFHIYNEYESSSFGLGLEAVALDLLAVRLGYYHEKHGKQDDPGVTYVTKETRKGITWGLGAIIPADKWSNGKLPFELRFDVLAKNLLDWVDEPRSLRVSSDFTDKKLMLALGLELNIK